MVAQNKNLKIYNRILGIEISENNIFAVEIQFIKNNIQINNAFRLNVPVFKDLNQTVAYIKQNLKAFNIKTKECAVGLSMQFFKFFPVPIPKTIPQDEIDSIIMQEGNVNTNDESATWISLNNTQRQDPDGVVRYDVLGISIQKSIVESIKLICKKSGLNLVSLSPSFIGIGSFLSPQVTNNLVATLWISQIRSEFVVWSGQEPIYEHLFLTHQLNDHVFQSVNFIQAQLAGAQVAVILACGPFLQETNLSQVPYNVQPFVLPQGFYDKGQVLQKVNIAEIMMALGTACSASNNIPFLIPNLLVSMKSQVRGLQDVFKDISKSKSTKSKSVTLPFVGKSLDPQISKFIFASIIILLVSIFLNFIVQGFLMPSVQANLSSMESRILLAQTHLAKVLNYEKTNKVLKIKIDFFSELIDKRKPWSKILREIGDMAPKDLWIDRLEVRNNNIDVFGRALNVDAIANFSINLNYTAKLLGKAQIIALRKFQEEGVDIIEYQVSVKVKDISESVAEKKEINTSKFSPKT